jgi:deoxyguanosine kinase
MYIISVEGNIGSGKSTLIKYMKEQLKEIDNIPVIYLPEPVDIWESIKSEDGKNMIQKFYENQERYSFAFQMMAYISRLKIFKDAINQYPNAIIITERCLLTDYNIFAKMLYESKKMLKEEYDIYKQWFNYFNEIEINQIIYIKTDPDISYERCVKRNRTGENTISLEYLTECNKMHDEWIENEKYKKTPIYFMDGNVNMVYSVIDHMDNYNPEISYHVPTYKLEINKITRMIEENLKTYRLNNIMLCVENLLIDDNSDTETHDTSILTDDERDELTNTKSDDSCYQLSEKSDTEISEESVSDLSDIFDKKDEQIQDKPSQINVSIDFKINPWIIICLLIVYYM